MLESLGTYLVTKSQERKAMLGNKAWRKTMLRIVQVNNQYLLHCNKVEKYIYNHGKQHSINPIENHPLQLATSSLFCPMRGVLSCFSAYRCGSSHKFACLSHLPTHCSIFVNPRTYQRFQEESLWNRLQVLLDNPWGRS